MANETEIAAEEAMESASDLYRDTHDDSHFEESLAARPVYATLKAYGYGQGGYGNTIWFHRTKNRPARNIDPFTWKTKVKIVSTIIGKKEKAGLACLQLYEFVEVRYNVKLSRITLGAKEVIMDSSEYEAEYRSLGYDLCDAVKVIRHAVLSGLLPKDFINQEVMDLLDDSN